MIVTCQRKGIVKFNTTSNLNYLQPEKKDKRKLLHHTVRHVLKFYKTHLKNMNAKRCFLSFIHTAA